MSEITTADAPDYTGPIIVSSEPHAETGVRRVDLWRGHDGGSFGDDSRGYVLTARYVSGDGKMCAEVEFSPVESVPITSDITEHALMQGATREQVADWTDDQLIAIYGQPRGCYGVDQRTTIGEAVYECVHCGREISCAASSGNPWIHGDGMALCDEDHDSSPAAEPGDPRPDDSADIDYEGGSPLAFDTLEDAQREADRLGREDLSGYFSFKVTPTEADACAAPCPHCGGKTAETCNCMEVK